VTDFLSPGMFASHSSLLTVSPAFRDADYRHYTHRNFIRTQKLACIFIPIGHLRLAEMRATWRVEYNAG